MVKFKLKMNRFGQLYMPVELRKELGMKLEAIANVRAVLIFPKGLKASDVLKSVKVIVADLKHRAQLEESHEETCKNGKN
ncbi:MAG TPA: hypothetical protein ENG10_01435 [Candidatus Bathyarchaeota archaeon]|nr:hypothetical protein [Candidatus Bathyarchaeota archaeon]HEX68944.1 hypothetical protein [Candidatus Bathyarchaeota archaeon]